MRDEPDSNSESTPDTGKPLSTRAWLRIAVVLYLGTLPACTHDAGHFGPGFFPLLASLVLAPIAALWLVFDLGVLLAEWISRRLGR